jgi:AmiR/NasT family two-component response regulator
VNRCTASAEGSPANGKALTNRDLIGQARGILMERFAIDPVTAFSLLAQLSKDRRQSVSAVALIRIASRRPWTPISL